MERFMKRIVGRHLPGYSKFREFSSIDNHPPPPPLYLSAVRRVITRIKSWVNYLWSGIFYLRFKTWFECTRDKKVEQLFEIWIWGYKAGQAENISFKRWTIKYWTIKYECLLWVKKKIHIKGENIKEKDTNIA